MPPKSIILRFPRKSAATSSTPPTASSPSRRATLRDLYTSGLVSIFRRDSILRVWEPLRETPRRIAATDPDESR